ncbi:MAG TPA: glycosyltransferase family 4 protein [Bryobacteraceae bacterium]|nr:glycosyltransferase family 4 protein [Bryobacteraceae bacterium]
MQTTIGRGARRTALVWCSNVEPAGGMERVALSVANGLVEQGWHVLLVGPFSRVPFLRKAIRPEIEFIDHQIQRSPSGMFQTARCLNRIIRERRVQVVSAHGSVFPLLFTGTPVVWTEHDVRYAGGEMLRGFRGVAWRRIRRLVEDGSWRLVTVSRHVQREICQKLDLAEDHATVIYNGLPNAGALHSLPAPRFEPPYRIGFLGRLVPPKRPFEVLELSSRLNAMGIPHVWKVFGDGVLLPAMRKKALHTPGHSVEFCGVVERPEEAFRELDLLCFHARGEQEGLGMVLVEALAANRPVVAWDAGCIREVLTGRGTLVPPPFSLARFAATIAGTLLGGAPPRQPDDRWSEARMMAQYDEILRDSIRRTARIIQND